MRKANGWQLKGNAPEAYEQYMVPAFTKTWAEDLVGRAEPKKGEHMLDAACGTGIVARSAALCQGADARITGSDINEVMLDKAREIGREMGISVEWRQGDIMALPFSDATFDLVLCQQGLQYFSDKEMALKEMRRVLVPGGRILASVWRSMKYFPFYTVLHEALGRYVGSEAADILSSAFTLGDARELKALFGSAGFGEIRVDLVIRQMRHPSLEAFVIGGMAASPFAPDFFGLDDETREEMLRHIETSMSDYMDDSGLAAPMEVYVLSALNQ